MDLAFSNELDALIKEVRSLGLFRVHPTWSFSHVMLLNAMPNAWSSWHKGALSIKGHNLPLFQFHYLGDWERVMEGGSWVFRGSSSDDSRVYMMDSQTSHIIPLIRFWWERIKGILDGLVRKKELAKKVAKKVGEPQIKVTVNEGNISSTNTLRAHVFLDVNKPLVRFVLITQRERNKYPDFDKLLDFCQDREEEGRSLHQRPGTGRRVGAISINTVAPLSFLNVMLAWNLSLASMFFISMLV